MGQPIISFFKPDQLFESLPSLTSTNTLIWLSLLLLSLIGSVWLGRLSRWTNPADRQWLSRLSSWFLTLSLVGLVLVFTRWQAIAPLNSRFVLSLFILGLAIWFIGVVIWRVTRYHRIYDRWRREHQYRQYLPGASDEAPRPNGRGIF